MKALGIGEILWDIFPDARRLGGAPYNFAYHVHSLGGTALVASCVGDDESGREILDSASAAGIPTDHIQTAPSRPTGAVTVELSEAGVPEFTIHEDSAWDSLEMTGALEALAGELDAVCFGTLAQRNSPSRETIRRFLELAREAGRARRIFDVNLRQSFYTTEVVESSLDLADVVKLNSAELEILSGMLEITPGDDLDRLRDLVARYGLELAALTLGSAGCVLASRAGSVRAPAPSVIVADTVGSGDAFSAALALGLAEEMLPEELAGFCNLAGAYVATKPGATPPVDRETLEEFGRSLG